MPGLPATVIERVDPALVKQLARKAIEAAMAAGVTYADVRLTRTVTQGNGDEEDFGVGVRCLQHGYWGFAASAVWTLDEMVALAQGAALRATANAKGPTRPIEWAPVPVVTGDWSPPIEIDPFTVPLEERWDYANALNAYVQRAYAAKEIELSLAEPGVSPVNFGLGRVIPATAGRRQEWALATSEGSYVTQTLYDGAGWEVYRHSPFLDQLPAVWEAGVALAHVPVKSVELGRYDIVLSGAASAGLVAGTLGPATQLDRAMGYLANAGGTSYLGPDPLALLGSYQVGSPLLTVTANRSQPGRPATVKWDAEGIEPETATLVKDGILTDYQTTREQAGWLAPYYRKVGRPVRSHGYAWNDTALTYPTLQTPNLVLEGGHPGTPVAEMIKSVKKGIYFGTGGAGTDFQANTGTFAGQQGIREIVNGQLGARYVEVGWLFTRELWKQLVAVGPASEAAFAGAAQGVPLQFRNQTVTRGG